MKSVDFERIFEALPSPHMAVDRKLRYVAANRAYEQAVMRQRGELIGNVLFDLFPDPGESGRRLKESFEHVIETGESDTIPFISYDIPRPESQGGGMEKRYWSAAHTPITDDRGEVRFVMQNTVDVTDMVRLREAASLPFRARSGEAQLIERAREAEEAHQSLLAESAEFRRLFQLAPGFFAVLAGADHVFTFSNDAYTRLVGGRDVVGKPVAEALPEIEGQGFIEMLDAVYTTGVPSGGQAMRLMLQREPGQPPRETFLDFSYDPIRDTDGLITGIFVQGTDRTETVRTLRQQRLLLDELNHRVKNTLATVQSIASHSFRGARDVASARKDFESRIIALSRAHNMLSKQQWSETQFHALVGQEFAVYGQDRVQVSGPIVRLNSKASIALAMVVHELSTNAASFGALSSPQGRVSMSWRHPVSGEEGLEVRWEESGGPPVAPPSRKGFGTRMIEKVLTGELGGTYAPDYAEQGFRCAFFVPATSYAEVNDIAAG